MSIAKKILEQKTASLELMKAVTKDGRPFFAYIVIRQTELNELKNKNGVTALPKNSIVLFSDFGHDIPDGVEEQVMEDFKQFLKNPE